MCSCKLIFLFIVIILNIFTFYSFSVSATVVEILKNYWASGTMKGMASVDRESFLQLLNYK